jgi:hypothetical protein
MSCPCTYRAFWVGKLILLRNVLVTLPTIYSDFSNHFPPNHFFSKFAEYFLPKAHPISARKVQKGSPNLFFVSNFQRDGLGHETAKNQKVNKKLQMRAFWMHCSSLEENPRREECETAKISLEFAKIC